MKNLLCLNIKRKLFCVWLISNTAPRWILTAAHCVYPNNVEGNKAGDEITLLDQTITISTIHSHPNHTQEGTLKHDIALILLLMATVCLYKTLVLAVIAAGLNLLKQILAAMLRVLVHLVLGIIMNVTIILG